MGQVSGLMKHILPLEETCGRNTAKCGLGLEGRVLLALWGRKVWLTIRSNSNSKKKAKEIPVVMKMDTRLRM